MKKFFPVLFFLPFLTQAQFITQGIASKTTNNISLNGTSATPYAGRAFWSVPFNLNTNFQLRFNVYMGNTFNNGMAFLFIPGGTAPTTTYPPTVISTDNIHNFGTGSIANDFVIELDMRGSFCTAGQNVNYEPTTDINHVAYWRNNSACTFGNYTSTYSALGAINYYSYEPYEIKWTKATNTLEFYYKNVLIKSNVVDLVGQLGANVYWGFSAACYCVPGGPALKNIALNSLWLLPFSVTSFNGNNNNNHVELKWETAQEQNTAHFIVEKSIDGIHFAQQQKINAAGNSSRKTLYSAIDNEPFYGTNFYRLKMMDNKGDSGYSEVVALKVNSRSTAITVFPNPVANSLHLQIPAAARSIAGISLTDSKGIVVQQQNIQMTGSLLSTTMDVKHLAKGIYFLTLQYPGHRETKKIIKQ